MKYSLISAVALSVLLLAGCDMTTPSQISLKQIEIRRVMKTETLEALHPDAARAGVVARAYESSHEGPVTLTVSYLKGHLAAAKKGASDWRALFVKEGVDVATVDTVVVDDPAFANQMVVTWPAKVALPPQGCGRIPGYRGADTLDYAGEYGIGCETESALARQIVNPDDLMGRDGSPASDARRQGGLVEKHRSGKPNEKLKGLNASGGGE